MTTQGADNQNRQQVQEENAINSQKEENITSNGPRDDYTDLRRVYTAKAIAQTLFDLIIATSKNKGPKYKMALVI